jgi:hypothetical protein
MMDGGPRESLFQLKFRASSSVTTMRSVHKSLCRAQEDLDADVREAGRASAQPGGEAAKATHRLMQQGSLRILIAVTDAEAAGMPPQARGDK